MENKPYSHFAYNGNEDACAYVFPKGYWRGPSEAEVRSWATDYIYPHIQSYAQGIAVKFGSNPVEYIDAPYYISSTGAYAQSASRGTKSVMLGSFYYAYRIPGSDSNLASYPISYPGTATNSAPLANIATTGFSSRPVSAVFCIRD